MRSIFWIGCILVVLVSLLASGAIAESVNSSTVEAAVAQASNVTDVAKEAAANVGSAAAKAENMTDAAKEVAVAAGLPGVANVTDAVKEVATTVGSAAAKAENVTDTAKQALATIGAAPGAEKNLTNVTNVSTEKVAVEADLVNDTLVKFVTDARTFAKNKGQAAAVSAFNNPMGGFVNDKMYIFAYDYNGKALALPYNVGSVGQNLIGMTDSSGFRYVQQMRDQAKLGKGAFVKYSEVNPLSKGVVMKKVSYVTDVDGNYWIGAGVFMSDDKKVAAKVVAKPTTAEKPVDANATMPAATPSSDMPVAANVTASNSTAVPA